MEMRWVGWTRGFRTRGKGILPLMFRIVPRSPKGSLLHIAGLHLQSFWLKKSGRGHMPLPLTKSSWWMLLYSQSPFLMNEDRQNRKHASTMYSTWGGNKFKEFKTTKGGLQYDSVLFSIMNQEILHLIRPYAVM